MLPCPSLSSSFSSMYPVRGATSVDDVDDGKCAGVYPVRESCPDDAEDGKCVDEKSPNLHVMPMALYADYRRTGAQLAVVLVGWVLGWRLRRMRPTIRPYRPRAWQ